MKNGGFCKQTAQPVVPCSWVPGGVAPGIRALIHKFALQAPGRETDPAVGMLHARWHSPCAIYPRRANHPGAAVKKSILPLVLLVVSCAAANPHFTIGSNPFYTYLAYPHDILRWPKKAAFFYMHPQTLPWQGHVTNINERPNDTYISNYNYFDFPAPSGYSGDPNAVRSFMRVSA